MTQPIDIAPQDMKTLHSLLSQHLPGVAAWAYGSRVKWNSRPNSDLDLVVFAPPERRPDVAALRTACDESNLPFRVDLFVWDEVPEKFRKTIEAEHVAVQVGRAGDGGAMEEYRNNQTTIPVGWRECTLGEVVTLQRGHDLPKTDRGEGVVPVLGSFGVTGYHDEARAPAPGVTVGRSGASFGVVSYSSVPYWPLNTALYAIDFHGNDERFVYYFLKSLDFSSFNTGSAQPSLNRNHIHPIPVCIPAPLEQRAIAGVLGALDDKIEQNRRTAQALEDLAQSIFQAWFVDFEPVKAKSEGATSFPSMPRPVFDALPTRFVDSGIGPVPEGWEIKSITEIATFLNGLALQKYPPRGDGEDLRVIKIAQLRKGSTDGADWANDDVAEPYVINDGDLLFSWSGTLEAQFWFGGKGALNQHLFKVTSSYCPSWFCYFWIRQHLPWFRMVAESKATTMGHIKRSHLQEAQVAVPPKVILFDTNSPIGKFYDLHAQLMIETRNLSETRDLLRPKLLSGEMRVHRNGRTGNEP
ncbi:MAG: restriction endonuclease subunit S [Kiritimatiellia bacterium]